MTLPVGPRRCRGSRRGFRSSRRRDERHRRGRSCSLRGSCTLAGGLAGREVTSSDPGRVMLPFEGPASLAIVERLAAAPVAGMSLFRFTPFVLGRPELPRLQRGAGGPHSARAASSPCLRGRQGRAVPRARERPTIRRQHALARSTTRPTERVGVAIRTIEGHWRELLYAPVLDLATNRAKPALGILSSRRPVAGGRHGRRWSWLQAPWWPHVTRPGMWHISTIPTTDLVVDAHGDDTRCRDSCRSVRVRRRGRLAMSGHAAVPPFSGRMTCLRRCQAVNDRPAAAHLVLGRDIGMRCMRPFPWSDQGPRS